MQIFRNPGGHMSGASLGTILGLSLGLGLTLPACSAGSGGGGFADTFGPMDTDGDEDPGGTSGGSGQDPGTTGDPSSTGGDVDPGDAARLLVEARCQWFFGCCSTGELEVLVGPFTVDAETCTDRVMDALAAGNTEPPLVNGSTDELLKILFAARSGHSELVEDAVDACLEQLAAESCSPIPEPGSTCAPDEPIADDPCGVDRLLLGTRGPGETCNPALPRECGPGLGCVDLGGVGLCAELAAEGDTCFTDRECDAGLACHPMTGSCVVASGPGEACSFVDPDSPVPGTELQKCAAGLACDPVTQVCIGSCREWSHCDTALDCPGELQCLASRCQGPMTWDGPCAGDQDCASGVCEPGSSRCTPLLATGLPCTTSSECMTGWCEPTTDLCTATVPLGGSCASGKHEECGAKGACVSLVCTGLPGPGEPCHPTTNPCAEGAACSSGYCLGLPLPNGTACKGDDQCASGLCEGTCSPTAKSGDPCGASGDLPCGAGLFCDLQPGVEPGGSCRTYRAAGEACHSDKECAGGCIVAWGAQVCDATPLPGQAWCGG